MIGQVFRRGKIIINCSVLSGEILSSGLDLASIKAAECGEEGLAKQTPPE